MPATEQRSTIEGGPEDWGLPIPDAHTRAFWIGLTVVLLAVVSGFSTFFILTGLTPVTPTNEVVLSALFINGLLILAMIAVIAWQAAGLLRAWRNKIAGARLHVRIVALFSVIAALPALLLAVAATTSFSRSLDNWFSTRTRQIVESSLDVANAYLEEHGQVIRTDIVNMAKDLDDAAPEMVGKPQQFRDLVMVQAGLRDLPSAYVIDASGKPIVAAIEDAKLPYIAPPKGVIEAADAGQVPLLMPTTSYRVAAVTKLPAYPGSYLYVARSVSPNVLGHLRRTQAGVAEYDQLRRGRGGVKWAHALMYLTISFTALLAAIWAGMWFAGRFVAPIRRLIAGAQHVSRGNLNIQLPIKRGEGDLRRLSQTFNTMTSELKTQRDALMDANEQLLERRQFMEAVLSGVSAGVLGLDAGTCITLASRSAEQLLGASEADLVGKTLSEAVPEFAALLKASEEQGIKPRTQDQVTRSIDGEERTFAVRVTRMQSGSEDQGAVITFDDITELVSAQRTSAWADVARRIAHEIKNPLTPIQLSAERIRRKYGRTITEDRETFDKLTETIERQAGHIKSMVDEFASFARMPKPQIEDNDLRLAVQEPIVLFREGHPTIRFKLEMPDHAVRLPFDLRLISQAITNLVKNAAEAVQQAAEAPDCPPDYEGFVEARVLESEDRAVVEVIDNGIGLAKQNRSRLLEPYVTTKAKGTGLGLAIVQKVIEQHGGVLSLEDAPPAPGRTRGALVRIVLPLRGAGGASTDGPRKSVAAE